MKIMTVYAHPADTITNCGGTLALHHDNGDEIVAVILTHGGRIHPNVYAEEWRKANPDDARTHATLSEIAANKERELRAAAAIIGIDQVITLNHDDTMATVHEDVVEEVARLIAEHRPDVLIADYPMNPVVTAASHTIATMTAIAAIERAGSFLKNLDGTEEVNVKQVFLGGMPTFAPDALSLHGTRNDLHIDITDVVDRKLAAMDQFVSQGYDGLFARKLLESHNGEFGRCAGVNFAEAFVRYRNETHRLLPVTEHAQRVDPLTRHISYSEINVRERFPVQVPSADSKPSADPQR
ncbi:PIG-L deacetylase family protein [Aestuariimicrobium soli]|uniref:PIG-L deacetylase family protein n=1 Tax=Aestuariimicrobium soli TaxID=2035834 RepID=UPI003EBB7309